MNGYNFTERVRRVLQLARSQALQLGHEYVGTEHLLLGICAEGEGVAVAVLRSLNVDVASVVRSVQQVVRPGKAPTDRMDLPYTSRAKKVLELSMSEARDLAHGTVGTEHLLLGLIREEKGIAAQVLHEHGATIASVRPEVIRLRGDEVRDAGASPAPRARHRPRPHPVAITIVVEHADGTLDARKFPTVFHAMTFMTSLEQWQEPQ